jgi:energy-converting hydrogenase Eha subunit E
MVRENIKAYLLILTYNDRLLLFYFFARKNLILYIVFRPYFIKNEKSE